MPNRIARAFVERMEHADGNDPSLALIRSAASDGQAATDLYTAMRRSSMEAYRTVPCGPDTDERVDLLASQLIGVVLSRYVLRGGPVAEMPPDRLVAYLTRALRYLVSSDPALGDAGRPSEAVARLRRIADRPGVAPLFALGARRQAAFSTGEVGRTQQAVRMFRSVVSEAQEPLPDAHPDLLDARGQLAYCTGETGS